MTQDEHRRMLKSRPRNRPRVACTFEHAQQRVERARQRHERDTSRPRPVHARAQRQEPEPVSQLQSAPDWKRLSCPTVLTAQCHKTNLRGAAGDSNRVASSGTPAPESGSINMQASASSGSGPAGPHPRSADEIREWIVTHVGAELGVDSTEIRLDEPLINAGLDSMQFVALVGDLERWLGCRFRDNPLIDYPTANALADYLAEQTARGKFVIDPMDRS
jgi:acyl carrier protein